MSQMYPGQIPTAQQRLAMMQAQYPQFAQGNMNYGQYPLQYLKCRVVTNEQEARAALIDLDGSLHVFVNATNGEIYTKQISLDGSAAFEVYCKAQMQQGMNTPMQQSFSGAQTQPSDQQVFIQRNEFADVVGRLSSRINELEDFLTGGTKNDATTHAANADGSKVSKSAANGTGKNTSGA